jgi:hypothetical protein
VTLPSRYGQGLGGYKAIEGDVVTLRLVHGGVNISKSPAEIEEGESPNASDVRFGEGGISTDYPVSQLGSASGAAGDKTIIGLAEFTKKNLPGNNRLVRMRPGGWDRWDGTSWLALGGTLSGLATDRVYSVVMQDKLIVANRVNKLKSWNGLDGSSVTDLSADSPIAWFITPIGNRLMAARVDIGGETDPYGVKWSADGNIANWTSQSLGAGGGTLEPEVRGAGPDFIMGLSAVETAAVILRQKSIVLGTRTGIGSQPFRFATVIMGLGTEAPYTVVNAGQAIGVIFLGSDLNVYLFDTRSAPIPIGDPIHLFLKSQIQNPELCAGCMDLKSLKYWLLIKREATLPDMAWIFDVGEYVVNKRLSWVRRDLSDGFASIAFARTALQTAPVVNSVNDVVNTVGIRVNDYGLSVAEETIVLGGSLGVVKYVDETQFLGTGTWESKMLGKAERSTLLDRTFLICSSPTGAVAEISISTDGGVTWVLPKAITIPATVHPIPLGTWFNIVVERWQYRLRILFGNVTISEIRSNASVRGPVGT